MRYALPLLIALALHPLAPLSLRRRAGRRARARSARRAQEGAHQVCVEPSQVGRHAEQAVRVRQRLPIHRGVRNPIEDHPAGLRRSASHFPARSQSLGQGCLSLIHI